MALHLFNSPAEDPANDPGPSMTELLEFWGPREGPNAWRDDPQFPHRVWALEWVDSTERGEEGLTYSLYRSKESALFDFASDRMEYYDLCGSNAGDAAAFARDHCRTATDALAELMSAVQDLRDEGWWSEDGFGAGDQGWRLTDVTVSG